jgi:hypothetical protein
MSYWYPSGLAKTFCKWDIYVPLVMKGLSYMESGFGRTQTFLFSIASRQPIRVHPPFYPRGTSDFPWRKSALQ